MQISQATKVLSSTKALSATNVRKSFGVAANKVEAVTGVDLYVGSGEVLGILGPNGAGKTTLINILLGYCVPDFGNISLFGENMITSKDFIRVKDRIGVSLQHGILPDLLTIDELLSFLVTLYKSPPDKNKLIRKLGLEHKKHSKIKELSGGQKQRAALAIALAGSPSLLLLDERTSHLDPQARRSVWDLILEQKKNKKSILITTHQMEEAERLCDRVMIMDHGRIIAEGKPQSLIDKYCSSKKIIFCCDNPSIIDEFKDEQLHIEPFENRFKVEYIPNNFSTAMGLLGSLNEIGKIDLSTLSIVKQNLEDVFLKLTGKKIRS